MSDSMREAFAVEANKLRIDLTRGHTQPFAYEEANNAWKLWQSATSQSQQEIADLRKQVAERDALLVEKDRVLLEMHNFKFLPIGLTMRIKQALSKTIPSDALERALEKEREKCAKKCDEYAADYAAVGIAMYDRMETGARTCAEAIRSMK